MSEIRPAGEKDTKNTEQWETKRKVQDLYMKCKHVGNEVSNTEK